MNKRIFFKIIFLYLAFLTFLYISISENIGEERKNEIEISTISIIHLWKYFNDNIINKIRKKINFDF